MLSRSPKQLYSRSRSKSSSRNGSSSNGSQLGVDNVPYVAQDIPTPVPSMTRTAEDMDNMSQNLARMLNSMHRYADDYPTTSRRTKEDSNIDVLLDSLGRILEKRGDSTDVLLGEAPSQPTRTRGRAIYGRNVSRDRSTSRERIRRHSVSFDREGTLQSMSCYGKVLDIKENLNYAIRDVFDNMVILMRRNDYEVNYVFVREGNNMQDFIDSITRFMSKEVAHVSIRSFEVYTIGPGKYRGGTYFQELTFTHVINVLNDWTNDHTIDVIRILRPV